MSNICKINASCNLNVSRENGNIDVNYIRIKINRRLCSNVNSYPLLYKSCDNSIAEIFDGKFEEKLLLLERKYTLGEKGICFELPTL